MKSSLTVENLFWRRYETGDGSPLCLNQQNKINVIDTVVDLR